MKHENSRRVCDFPEYPATALNGAAQDATVPHCNSTLEYLVARYGLTLATADFAREFHCHPSHVRDMCAKGILPAVRIGERWRIPAAKVAAIIESGVLA